MKLRRTAAILTAVFFLLFQSSVYANSHAQVLGVKPNFLFIFLIYLGFISRTKVFLISTVTAGLLCDMLSNGIMGFSIFTFYVSLLPMLWIKDWVLSPAAPVFMLTVFALCLFKGLIESVLLAFYFDASFSGGYLRSIVLLEVMLTTLAALILHFAFKVSEILLSKWESRDVQVR